MTQPTTGAGRQLVKEARPKLPMGKLPDVEAWWGYRQWASHRVSAVEAEARASAEWRDHIPSGYEDQSGYGQVSCSCGWDSSDKVGWEEHIDAAERIGRA